MRAVRASGAVPSVAVRCACGAVPMLARASVGARAKVPTQKRQKFGDARANLHPPLPKKKSFPPRGLARQTAI